MAKVRYDVTGVPDAARPSTWPILQNGQRAVAPDDRLSDSRHRLYSAEELGQFPPVRWLIPGWLAAEELTVIYGPGDSYKSFTALSWACQLAAEDRVVVYIAAEGASGLRARIAAWQTYHEIPVLPTLKVMPDNTELHEKAGRWVEDIRFELTRLGVEASPDLVVVDTVARNFVGGNENDPKEMGLFVEGCEIIRKQLNTAVAAIHHQTKDGKSERGTLSLRNASFAMVRVEKTGRQATLKCDRMKDAEPPRDVTVTFRKVPMPTLDIEATVDGRMPSSLAMDQAFPPRAGAVADPTKRSELRAGVVAALRAKEPRGANPILEAVRSAGLAIAQEEGRALLKEFAADPDDPITSGRDGYYLRKEAK